MKEPSQQTKAVREAAAKRFKSWRSCSSHDNDSGDDTSDGSAAWLPPSTKHTAERYSQGPVHRKRVAAANCKSAQKGRARKPHNASTLKEGLEQITADIMSLDPQLAQLRQQYQQAMQQNEMLTTRLREAILLRQQQQQLLPGPHQDLLDMAAQMLQVDVRTSGSRSSSQASPQDGCYSGGVLLQPPAAISGSSSSSLLTPYCSGTLSCSSNSDIDQQMQHSPVKTAAVVTVPVDAGPFRYCQGNSSELQRPAAVNDAPFVLRPTQYESVRAKCQGIRGRHPDLMPPQQQQQQQQQRQQPALVGWQAGYRPHTLTPPRVRPDVRSIYLQQQQQQQQLWQQQQQHLQELEQRHIYMQQSQLLQQRQVQSQSVFACEPYAPTVSSAGVRHHLAANPTNPTNPAPPQAPLLQQPLPVPPQQQQQRVFGHSGTANPVLLQPPTRRQQTMYGSDSSSTYPKAVPPPPPPENWDAYFAASTVEADNLGELLDEMLGYEAVTTAMEVEAAPVVQQQTTQGGYGAMAAARSATPDYYNRVGSVANMAAQPSWEEIMTLI